MRGKQDSGEISLHSSDSGMAFPRATSNCNFPMSKEVCPEGNQKR